MTIKFFPKAFGTNQPNYSNQIPMSKTQIIFFVFLLLFSSSLSNAKAVQCGPYLGIFCPGTDKTEPVGIILIVIQYLFSVIALFSLLFMIIGGIKYITSAGSEEKIISAKNSLTSAAYGLIIAVMAYAILSIINTILNKK